MGEEPRTQKELEETNRSSPEAKAGTKFKVKKFEHTDHEVGFEEYAPGGKRHRPTDNVHLAKKEDERNLILMFTSAIENKDLYKSFLTLKQVFYLNKEAVYSDFKNNFIELIDYFLAKDQAEVVEKYHADLELLREFVLQDKYAYLPTQTDYLEQLSEFGQASLTQEVEASFEQAKKEVVLGVFEGAITPGSAQDVYVAYLQLVKARELEMTELSDMKERFLNFIDEELAKDSKDLEKAAKVHLLGLKQRLQELESSNVEENS